MIQENNEDLSFNYSKFTKEYQEKIASIPTHRPVKKIIKYSENHSPIKITTPRKNTKLPRIAKIGPLSFYSNDPKSIPIDVLIMQEKVEDKKGFKKSKIQKKITTRSKPPKKSKTQDINITKKSLKKTAKEIKKANGKRSKSQNAVMGGGATAYVESTGVERDTNDRREWSHLCAHRFRGKASQNSKNLIATTNHANTNMMFVEDQVPSLVHAAKDGVKLSVEAPVIKGTHIAKDDIQYTLTVKNINKLDLVLPFSFHTQTPNKPLASQGDYLKNFTETSINQVKKMDINKPSNKNKENKAPKNNLLFFDKQKIQAKDQSSQSYKKLKNIR
jgi:hypothetical protein